MTRIDSILVLKVCKRVQIPYFISGVIFWFKNFFFLKTFKENLLLIPIFFFSQPSENPLFPPSTNGPSPKNVCFCKTFMIFSVTLFCCCLWHFHEIIYWYEFLCIYVLIIQFSILFRDGILVYLLSSSKENYL